MILLIDGDILVYRAGFACNEEPVQNALWACKMLLGSIRKRCDNITGERLFISADDQSNFRYEIAKTRPYKGNRKKRKPRHYAAIREYLVDVQKAELVTGQEADDALGIAQANAEKDTTVICTIDKDLDMIPGWHFNFVKNIKYYTTDEEANRWFYTQLLQGDSTDNIQGVEGIGPVKANKLLDGARSPKDYYNIALEAYDNNEELLTEMARLVWIRRKEEELWQPPVRSGSKRLSTDIDPDSNKKLPSNSDDTG